MKLAIAYLVTALLSVFVSHSAFGQQVKWPVEYYDPGKENHGAADLILPMPCGAAMAFQKVVVPIGSDDPLADLELRLGRPPHSGGYMDFFRTEYLRGGFSDGTVGESNSHYFISRYELTEGQYEAIINAASNNCPEPNRRMRLAKGGLSWFEAVDLGRIYSEWLHENAKKKLPAAGDGFGFVRLPTEPEWEYAARGGNSVTSTEFERVRFPMDGSLNEYARYMEDGEKSLGPAGGLLPNPLGVFDIYGNAKELVHELFRLNVSGRYHGQTGGFVTRGGSYQSGKRDINSAGREEWPLFSRTTGRPYESASIGARFVIASYVTTQSDQIVHEIQESWNNRNLLFADKPELGSESALATEINTTEFDQIAASVDEIADLKNLIELQRREAERLRTRIEELDESLVQEREGAVQMKTAAGERELLLSTLIAEKAELARILTSFSGEGADVGDRVKALLFEYSTATSRNEELATQALADHRILSDQAIQLAALQDERERLVGLLAGKGDKDLDVFGRVSDLLNELTAAIAKISELSEQSSAARGAIDEQSRLLATLHEEQQRLSDMLAEFGPQGSSLGDLVAAALSESDTLLDSNRRLRIELSEALSKVEETEDLESSIELLDQAMPKADNDNLANDTTLTETRVEIDTAERKVNFDKCITGRYPNSCDRSRLTRQEADRVDAAERKVNYDKCITGRYPNSCDRSRLTRQEADRVDAAERKVNYDKCITGRYPNSCDRSRLTRQEAERVDAAERKVNYDKCITGRYPNSCDRSRLTRQEAERVDAAERKASFEECEDGQSADLCDNSLLPRARSAGVDDAERKENLKMCMTGYAGDLCNRQLLSPSEKDLVDEAERKENLKMCMTGYAGDLCNRQLLSLSEKDLVDKAELKENFKMCMTGYAGDLCNRQLLSPSEKELVKEAERKENFKMCMTGYAGDLCNRQLLSPSEKELID